MKQQSQTSQRPELQTEYQDSVRIQISDDAEVNEEKEIMDLFQQVEQQGRIIAHGETIRIQTAPRGFLHDSQQAFVVSHKKSQFGDHRKAYNQSHFNEDIAHCQIANEYDMTNTQQLRDKTMTSFKKSREKKREFAVLPLKIQTYGDQFHLQNVRSSYRSNGSDGTSNALTSGRTTPFMYGTRYTTDRLQNIAGAQQTHSDFTNKNFILDNRNQKKKNSNQKISEHISSINLDADQIPNQFHPRQSSLRTQTQISKRFRGRKLLQNEHSIRYGSNKYNQFAQSCDVSVRQAQNHKVEPIMLDQNNGRFKQVKIQVYSNDELNETQVFPNKIPPLQKVYLQQRKTGNIKEQIESDLVLHESIPSQEKTAKQITLMALSMNQSNPIVLQQNPFPTKSQSSKQNRLKKLPKYENKMNSYYQKIDRSKKVSELGSIDVKQESEQDKKNDVVQKYLERVKAIQKHLEIRESLIIGKAAVELRSKNDFKRQSRLPRTQGLTLSSVNDVDLMLKMSQFIQYK